MVTTLIAALVIGLLAPWVRGKVWGVPFSLFSIGTVLASFVGSVLTTLLVGALFSVALRMTALTRAQIDPISGAIAALVALALLWSSARKMREVRGLSVLCQRLGEEDVRPLALRSIDLLLDRVERRNPRRHASLILMATGPLTQSASWKEARDWLLRIREDVLDPRQAVLRDQALATCHLQFDDTTAAREAIERIPRPAEDEIEIWLVAMEALLLAVEGDGAGASAKLRGQDTDDNPSLEASHRLVRAHIFAAEGNDEQARGELEELKRAVGRSGLVRVLNPRGPATELARSLLEEDGEATDQA